MWFALPLFFLGGFAGLVVCRLPGWLFLRHEKSLTAEELRDRYPQRAWVLSVWRGGLILAFVLFAPLFFTTDTKKELNVFFLPLVYITWMYALVGVLEVIKKTSVLIPLRQTDRVGFILSPKTLFAGLLRLTLTGFVVATFLSYR